MQNFILNLLGSLMLLYGLFSYTSGTIRAIVTKTNFSNSSAITAISIASTGLAILLTI